MKKKGVRPLSHWEKKKNEQQREDRQQFGNKKKQKWILNVKVWTKIF